MGVMSALGGKMSLGDMLSVKCAICELVTNAELALARGSADADAGATVQAPLEYSVVVLGTPACNVHAAQLLEAAGYQLPNHIYDRSGGSWPSN
jgi:hypothetical protein